MAAGYHHTLLLMLFGLGWVVEGGDTVVPPVEPDPVDPSGGTGTRRRRFAYFLCGGG